MTSTIKFDNWRNNAGDVVYDGSRGALPISRNLLYNGAMQVAQRGTSSTGITTSGYYTADRFDIQVDTMGTWTQTVEADGPTGSGFTKSLKMECTTADGSPAVADRVFVAQALEGQDCQGLKKGTSDAESLTLSFWVKSDTTGTYIVELFDNDNVRQISQAYTISSAGTWEKKTLTFAGDTTGAFTNDNSVALSVIWWLGAGTNYTSGTLSTSWTANTNANRAVGQTNLAASTSNYWQVTGVQLEVGAVASPFEHKSYGVELALCQRYYTVLSEGLSKNLGSGHYYTASYLLIQTHFPTTMRTAPSLVATSGTNYFTIDRDGAADSFNSLTITRPTQNSTGFYNNTEISGTSGTSGLVYLNNASASVALDSEL